MVLTCIKRFLQEDLWHRQRLNQVNWYLACWLESIPVQEPDPVLGDTEILSDSPQKKQVGLHRSENRCGIEFWLLR